MILAFLSACEPECGGEIILGAGSGGSVSVAWDAPQYVTAEQTDVLIDWSGLDADWLCEPMDPVEDVGTVGIWRFPLLEPEEVASGLVNDAVTQADTNGYAACHPETDTQCWLTEIVGGDGVDLSFYTADGATYMLALSGDAPLYGPRFFAFLLPTAESTVTEVTVLPECPGGPEVTVDLDGSAPVSPASSDSGSCADTGGMAWPLDWSALTSAWSVDEVVVARYALSVSELEAQFLDRDALAVERYSLVVVDQTPVDLGDATSSTGARFSGFEGDGTWLLELRQDESLLAIPLYVTVVEAG